MQTMPMIATTELPMTGKSVGAASGAGGEGFGLVLAGKIGPQAAAPHQGAGQPAAVVPGSTQMRSPWLRVLAQLMGDTAVPADGTDASVVDQLKQALQALTGETSAVAQPATETVEAESKAGKAGKADKAKATETVAIDPALLLQLQQQAQAAPEDAKLQAALAAAMAALGQAPPTSSVEPPETVATKLAAGTKPTPLTAQLAALAAAETAETEETDAVAGTSVTEKTAVTAKAKAAAEAAIDPRFAKLLKAADDSTPPTRMTKPRAEGDASAPTLHQAQTPTAPAADAPMTTAAAQTSAPTETQPQHLKLAQADALASVHAGNDKATATHHDLHSLGLTQQHDRAAVLAEPQGVVTLPSGHQVAEALVLDQVVTQMRGSADGESGQMVLRLHPAELGELKIDLVVEGDRLKAQLHAQTQQVQQVIERHLPRLRDALESQGLRLDQLQVSVSTEQGRGQQFQQQHNQQHMGWMGQARTAPVVPSWGLDADPGMRQAAFVQAGGLSLHV